LNELQIFKNESFGEIRTVEINGKPYFVAIDITKALGYSNSQDAIKKHCRWVAKCDVPHPQSQNKIIEVNAIPEGDLYRLITHSELPSAEKFELWVFDEVLPSIRKNGAYTNPKTPKADRTEVMMINARNRTANTYLKMAAMAGITDTYKQILVSKAAETLSGEKLLPLPKAESKTYSAEEVGKLYGITGNMIGRIANKHGLKQPEYGALYHDKGRNSPKEVETWRYNDNALKKFAEILSVAAK
jgi:prophage antirepressor-like protein